METETRSLFISSCTRRQMARRRGSRSARWMLVLLVLAAALGAFAAAQGVF